MIIFKVDDNQHEFRPIFLLVCLYKIIAKILTSKLNTIMDSPIVCNQLTFIPKRQIGDGIVVINKLVDLAKKYGRD